MTDKAKSPQTGQLVRRAFSVMPPSSPDDGRTLEFSFASDEPYRRWFGYEVLGMKEGEIDLSRMQDRAPMLLDHRNEVEYQIGVVEKVWLDGDKAKCRVKLFDGYGPQGSRATSFLNVLEQGAGGKISVGYVVNEYKPMDEKIDDTPVQRAVNWTPMEVSAVAVPADDSVGVGKSLPTETKQETEKMSEAATTAPEAQPSAETKAAPTPAPAAPAPAVTVVDNGKVRADILAIAQSDKYAPYGAEKLAMVELAKADPSVEAFRAGLMEAMIADAKPTKGAAYGNMPQEESRKFDFGNFRRALIHRLNGDLKSAEKEGGFEIEFSMEHTKALQASGLKQVQGFAIPIGTFADCAARAGALSTRVSSVNPNADTSGTTIGQGDLRGTDHRGDLFVEHLYNASAFLGNGATVMEGLQGNIEFPREGTVISTAWEKENAAHTPTDPTFSQTMLTPKRLSAGVVRTRQLLLQSDPSIDRILMRELTEGMAEAEDAAIIAADGTGDAPTGIVKELTDDAPGQIYVPQDNPDRTGGNAPFSSANVGYKPILADVVALETLLTGSNVSTRRGRYFLNAKTVGLLKTTQVAKDTNGVFLIDMRSPGMLNGYPYTVSNNVRSDRARGTGTGFSEMIFCDPSEVLVAHWGGASIQIDPYTQLDRDNVRMFIHRYVDIAVRRRESFAYTTAIAT